MPHISVKLYPGRSKEQLKEISQNIQKCLVDTTAWQPGDISVSVEEIEAGVFVEKVSEFVKNDEITIPSEFIK